MWQQQQVGHHKTPVLQPALDAVTVFNNNRKRFIKELMLHECMTGFVGGEAEVDSFSFEKLFV